jgi:long-chain acyl-CoA synthetase
MPKGNAGDRAMSEQRINSGIISGERYLSPQALGNNAARAASALHSVGVWQGDVVALLLRNDFAFFEATRGATLLGATTVPMNWHMSVDEIAYVLDDCDAKVLIAHSDLLSESVLAICGGREVIAVESPPEIAKAFSLEANQCRTHAAVPEWYTWLSAFQPWEEQPRALSNPMFYTSGTTGMPKGVLRKPVAPEVAARAMQRSAAAWGLGADAARSIMTGPLYHSAPNAYGMGLVRNGGLLVMQPRFDPEDMLAVIEQQEITHLHMVPTMFVRLLKLPAEIRNTYDLSSLQHVAHGAAPCPREVKQQMIDWWGPVIHEYYAMTETGIVAMCNSEEWVAHPGTVGRAPEGVDIEIRNEEGELCETGTPGQICVSSETTPYVAYHRAEEKTAELRVGNYIATGDVGYLDEDGFVYISDRISDMVISGGVNIYPAEVEKVLVTMPEVRDCAVFGVPDQEFGERLVSVVEVSKPMQGVALNRFLRERMSNYKVPREFLFVQHLPREDSGKIKKRLLRDAFIAGELS